MQKNNDSTKSLSDDNITAILRLAIEPSNMLEDLDTMSRLSPKELWSETIKRWKKLGPKWSDTVVANIFGIKVHRLKRWRRHRELEHTVRLQIAALYEMLHLIACGKLHTINDQLLSVTVGKLRGLPNKANNDTVKEVLSLFMSQFNKPINTPAI